jgi:hypothetical protein
MRLYNRSATAFARMIRLLDFQRLESTGFNNWSVTSPGRLARYELRVIAFRLGAGGWRGNLDAIFAKAPFVVCSAGIQGHALDRRHLGLAVDLIFFCHGAVPLRWRSTQTVRFLARCQCADAPLRSVGDGRVIERQTPKRDDSNEIKEFGAGRSTLARTPD